MAQVQELRPLRPAFPLLQAQARRAWAQPVAVAVAVAAVLVLVLAALAVEQALAVAAVVWGYLAAGWQQIANAHSHQKLHYIGHNAPSHPIHEVGPARP
jgi:hypothetical protein